MIRIKSFTFNPFQENTYLLYHDTGDGLIVDPGCHSSAEKNQLTAFVSDNGLKLIKLLNTHAHLDHIFGNRFVADTYGLELCMAKEDLPTLEGATLASQLYQISLEPSPEPTEFLAEGDTIQLGDDTLEVRFVPGHAPGHLVFICHAQKFVIGGDVLFRESIGRTDLPGGDHATLIQMIREKLWPLADDYVVYPGHGPTTTIGYEKRFNRFLR